MFYFLGQFADQISALNVFRYITFRTGGAIMTALFFVFLFGPKIISSLRIRQGHGQPIRADGPESHLLTKQGTPTMGGRMIMSGAMVAALLWSDLSNPYVWVVIGVTLGFGGIGFYDDYLKVTKSSHTGFGGKARLALEFLIAALAAYAVTILDTSEFSEAITFPFLKDFTLNLGTRWNNPSCRDTLHNGGPIACGGGTARDNRALCHCVGFTVSGFHWGHNQRAAQQAIRISDGGHGHVNLRSRAGKGGHGGCHEDGGHVFRAELFARHVDAQAFKDVGQDLFGEGRVAQTVAGAIKAHHKAIPHQIIAAHAVKFDKILDANGAACGHIGTRCLRTQCGERHDEQKRQNT